MNEFFPLLAVDTLSIRCSVAVWSEREIVSRNQGTGQRRHAREVLSLVDSVLAEGGTDIQSIRSIAVINGPGSFTGLRIGTSVVQGLAFAAQVSILPVSSLALLAMAAREQRAERSFCCLLRARPGEYYHARYYTHGEIPDLSGPIGVGGLDGIARHQDEWLACDADTAAALDLESIAAELQRKVVVTLDAALLARLAATMIRQSPELLVAPSAAAPVYVKDDLEYRKSGVSIS